MTAASVPVHPPAPGARIEINGLSKVFGDFRAVDNLSFVVEPGRVTGFLGPNGAGKTTTLRMLLGLIRPTEGTATINGQPYASLPDPMQTVGSALEATNFHPGRTGRDHLRVIAAASKVPDARVDELLELVGIAAAAKKRAGAYSLGMRQRLGLAAALLGDPRVLILDEPANGLDPEGIRWLRGFLRHLSSEGKTILISSHMLSEVEQTVDDVVIIANGRLVRQGSIGELHGARRSLVRTTDAPRLARALSDAGHAVQQTGNDSLEVTGDDPRHIGDTALAIGLPIYELRESKSDLEDMFFELTSAPENRNRNLGDGTPPPSFDVQQGGGQ
ncbi:ABC transporter ATP-binding protein [Luteipulveratus mongoliensis]|uniref:ABC transporter ATP-binding protein n=1 Tax=Luteipulveratus mongoliensis TaxID=571913 RepID=A0A0K1JLG2_9MICO|nr:ABC transporter ATP-binding protein [Luteipulveratus mongoliensis]AKU17557.1 ABC transporter ATP-binding protein [Luteipulveratus mongoliensis]